VFGRKNSRTHREQLIDELNESYGHLKLAAGHAAGGAAESITPTYDRARNVAARGLVSTRTAFEPLYTQVREGASQARERAMTRKPNRGPMLIGLLAAGAAVGAAGAIVARRRRAASQWDEYEPLGELEPGYLPSDRMPSSSKPSAKEKVSQGVAAAAEGVAQKAGKVADSLRSSSAGSAADTVVDKTTTAADKAATAADKAASAADTMTGKGADLADKAAGRADSAAQNFRDKTS
jgi:hypothetical protein